MSSTPRKIKIKGKMVKINVSGAVVRSDASGAAVSFQNNYCITPVAG